MHIRAAGRRWPPALGLLVGTLGGSSGCSDGNPPVIGDVVVVPPRPAVELLGSGLPQLQNGNVELIEVPGGRLEHDPSLRDPITALAACTDIVVGCVEPGARGLDDCFRSVRRCTTDTPWNEDACCPDACFETYETERLAGTDPFPAFEQTLFVDKTCMPGLVAALEGVR